MVRYEPYPKLVTLDKTPTFKTREGHYHSGQPEAENALRSCALQHGMEKIWVEEDLSVFRSEVSWPAGATWQSWLSQTHVNTKGVNPLPKDYQHPCYMSPTEQSHRPQYRPAFWDSDSPNQRSSSFFRRSSYFSWSPFLQALHHFLRSDVSASNWPGDMWQERSTPDAWSLNLLRWRPTVLEPWKSSPMRNCFGSRSSDMRITCPSQRRWFWLQMVSADTDSVFWQNLSVRDVVSPGHSE